jgi:UDP-GlcNAc:undecaprenyl-phosphate GlcNAc-1-phosphate transferase
MNGDLLWMAGKALIIALVLTPIFRDIFRSYNIVDKPAQRKVHAYPIPRVGGIPIAIAYGLSLVSLSGAPDSLTYGPPVWKLIPGAALIFLIGLFDDFFTLRPPVKLCGEIAAAGLVFLSGLRIETIGGITMPLWLSAPLTIFWILLSTNALNLIDGLDGLCAGMGLVATLTLFGAALLHGNLPLAYATLPLAGALIGFLVYNFSPATVFLGDSGALLIGFLLGCYGMIWTQKAATLLSMIVPILAISIPLLDVSLSILRRFLRRQPIFTADRGHIHHRLLDRGLSPRKAVLVLYMFAGLTAVFALLLSINIGHYWGLVILAFFGAVWVGIGQLKYSEFDVAGKFLFRGELQRTLDVRLRLENVSSGLAQAIDEKQWWDGLIQGAQTLGLVKVLWTGPGFNHEEVLSAAPSDWSLDVPLGEGEAVNLQGTFGPHASSDVLAFAELISRSFAARRLAAVRKVAVSS